MPGLEDIKVRVIQHAMSIEMTVRSNLLPAGCRSVSGFQITSPRFTNPREPTARAAKRVPGPSQATPFTARRASERSERGVNPACYLMATDRAGVATLPGRAVSAILSTSIGSGSDL